MIKFFMMNSISFLLPFLIVLTSCSNKEDGISKVNGKSHPNVIYILADDLGYGDLGCYNPDSKIPTPNVDKFSEEGVRFTDVHSPSAVCTPTRYGIMTGQYCWRSPLKKGVLLGYSRPIISSEQETVASMLKKAGYYTACIGKWHLGLGWALKDGTHYDQIEELYKGEEIRSDEKFVKENVDYSRPVSGGPNQLGFDYSFILPASLDFEPYCYLENGMLTAPPTSSTSGHDLNTGYTEAFWRAGNMAEGFEFERVLPDFMDKATNFINERADFPETPFFLYLPLAAPHTPWVPTNKFHNKSMAGTYGDFVNMIDHYIGNLLRLLEDKGLKENTMVILTSDNGAFWKDDYKEKYDHRANHLFRGMKADVWEGGNRVPFIVRWPGKTPPGTTSSSLVCLTDLMRTLSEIVNIELPEDAGIDSKSILPEILGERSKNPDRTIILQSGKGMFAVRKNEWKYIDGSGGGGFGFNPSDMISDDTLSAQLFNLDKDIIERENLLRNHPDIVKEITSYLDSERKKL